MITLYALPTGRPARILALTARDATRLDRLSALGLAPGSDITLEQRHPALIVRVGETEVCMDQAVALEIMVEAL